MNVELPSTGCNILNSSTTFYNYSTDRHTRSTYILYDGKAYLQSSVSNQYGYDYSGQCLTTGDLVYKPEYKEFLLPLTALVSFILILGLVYKIFIRGLMR